GLELVAIDPALDARGEPTVASLPREDVQQIWVGARHGELPEVALQVEPQRPRDRTDRAGEIHEAIAHTPFQIDAGGPGAGRGREIVHAGFEAGDVDREGRIQAPVHRAPPPLVD